METVIFNHGDSGLIDHIIDVIGDRMRSEDGYTERDEATVAKLERLNAALKRPESQAVLMLER